MRKATLALLGISTLLLALVLAGCGGGTTFPISITLSTSPAPTVDQGQVVTIAANVVNDKTNKGVTWSLSGLGSLSGQTTTTVTYVAPSHVSIPTKAHVTATSVADDTATTSIAIQVNPPPSVTTTSLPSGTAGTCYGQTSTSSGVTCNGATLAETGGTAPFTWGVISGQIPPGLKLDAGSGVISGTPTTPGTYTPTFQLTDSVGQSTSATLTIQIAPPPALTVSTTSVPTAAINQGYSVTLAASGGVAPYKWALASGTLPNGLGLSPGGVISGTPTVLSTYNFTVQVTDSEGPTPATATQALTIIVNPKAFSITTTSLPNGTGGIAYSTTLRTSGGVAPVTWSVATGSSLPAWASLNSTTGVISGAPSAADAGTTSFTIEATDSNSPTADVATEPLSITISATTQNSLLSGQYAFSLSGYGGGLIGSFTADGNGNITGGIEDLKAEPSSTAVSGTAVGITSGSYVIGADSRGILSFTDANSNKFTFDLALSSNSSSTGGSAAGSIIETDKSGDNFTGSFAQQNSSDFSSAVLVGGYAFGFSGWDSNVHPDVVVGSATIASGSVTGGLLDENDDGNHTSNVSFTGNLIVNGTTGRGTFTANKSQYSFTFYVVSKTEWFAMSYSTTSSVVRNGLVLQQSGGPYSDASITGTMVLQSQSLTSSLAPQAELGLLTTTAPGSLSATLDVAQGGSTTTAQSDTDAINFTSGTNGRFTLTPQSSSAFVGYMIAPNQAFIAGTGTLPSFGTFEPQSTGPFSTSSLAGSFFLGSMPLVAVPPSTPPAPSVASGIITFDGSVNLTGTLDSSDAGAVTTTALTDSYSVSSSGRVSVSPAGAIMYIVSPSKILILSTTGLTNTTNPLIQVAER